MRVNGKRATVNAYRSHQAPGRIELAGFVRSGMGTLEVFQADMTPDEAIKLAEELHDSALRTKSVSRKKQTTKEGTMPVPFEMVEAALEQAVREASALREQQEKLNAAIDTYFTALTNREHGDVAASKCLDQVCEIMGRPSDGKPRSGPMLEEKAPEGVWLIVTGGLAKKETGGTWISFNGRKLERTPTWWARIPDDY